MDWEDLIAQSKANQDALTRRIVADMPAGSTLEQTVGAVRRRTMSAPNPDYIRKLMKECNDHPQT